MHEKSSTERIQLEKLSLHGNYATGAKNSFLFKMNMHLEGQMKNSFTQQ
jgi:hypothetical protein